VLELKLDITGVALASVIAEWAGLFVTCLFVWLQRKHYYLAKWLVKFSHCFQRTTIINFMQISLDFIIRTILLFTIEAILLNSAAILGVTSLSAMEIMLIMFGVISYTLDGFAHSAEALVGQAIGSNKRKTLTRTIYRSTLMAFATSFIMSGLLYVGKDFIIPIFTNQIDLQVMVAELWLLLCFLPPLSVLAFQMDGIFIGAMRGREMRDTMFWSVLIFIGLLYIIPEARLDLYLVCFMITLLCRGILLLARLGHVTRLIKHSS